MLGLQYVFGLIRLTLHIASMYWQPFATGILRSESKLAICNIIVLILQLDICDLT